MLINIIRITKIRITVNYLYLYKVSKNKVLIYIYYLVYIYYSGKAHFFRCENLSVRNLSRSI